MFRLLEHYTSTQGECDRTGTPTQFVRFAGCNLKCAGWPCDTPFAIFPKQYMKEQKLIDVSELLADIKEATTETGVTNVCFTGGEPLLQPNSDLIGLVLEAGPDYTFEMFSNGTLEYPQTLMRECAIRMDWKLPGSHEDQSGPGWDIRVTNYQRMSHWDHHTIKFTIKDQIDLERALVIYDEFDMEDWPGSIYAGPVWEGDVTAKDIADDILAWRHPWKLNIQSHNYIYGAHTRRT